MYLHTRLRLALANGVVQDRGSRFVSQWHGTLYKRNAVLETILQRIVVVISSAFRAAFHKLRLFGKTGFFQHFLKARVVAQRVHNGVDFHPRRVLIFRREGFIECGEGLVFLT